MAFDNDSKVPLLKPGKEEANAALNCPQNDPHPRELPEKGYSRSTTTPLRFSKPGNRGNRPNPMALTVIAICVMFALLFKTKLFPLGELTSAEASSLIFDSARKDVSAFKVPSTNILNVFQVYQPILTSPDRNRELRAQDGPTPSDGSWLTTSRGCQVLLMEHLFGFSYGKPFIGMYSPPSCKFNHVIMNLTVTSKGRQFDRLAIMYFNDTEIWRTSTAEPTSDGIRWEYIKDMSAYLYFWNSPQKLIFDLGNLVDDTYIS